ncbi:hypothetical protein V499_05485 [Pseudogymnoascus sp. VKM F-103]|nr:hypothetical protein V499_05485 [Pseudogymnoascus sp. VKM F-103]
MVYGCSARVHNRSGVSQPTPTCNLPTRHSIVGVQGLGSDPFFTWVKKGRAPESKSSRKLVDKLWTRKDKKHPKLDGNNEPVEFMWPRDLLVPSFTNARVATYSYKSGKGVKTTLRQLAEQFLNVLFQHRQKPDALVIAALNRDFQELRLSVSGVIFLGAPFQGSNAAVLGKRLAQVTGGDLSLLELLQKDNTNLQSLSKEFSDSHHEWDFVCFYEDTDADYTLFKTRVVTASSATLSGRRMIFLHTDHSGLNKFSGSNDENYALVLPELQRMVNNGPSMVANRFKPKVGEPAGNKHWLVPRGINKLFTGRSEIIDRIKAALQDDGAQHAGKQKVFVITGLGGMGKTEICLQVANILREDFWGVFWVDVDSESTAKNDFISAVASFGSSAKSVDDARRLLANTKHNWLLILDNADDPEFDYQAYLPSGSRGVVLVTSRIYDCSQYSTVGSEVLTSLDIGLSKQLLLRAANIAEDLWPSVDQQAEDIAKLIGSHTLALIQAGTYIAKGYSRLDQYPEVYGKHRKRLLTYRPSQAQSRYGDVYATFEASAQILENSESEDARDALRLLGILSMLHSSALPLQIFENAWNRSRNVLHVSDTEIDLGTCSRWHALQLPEFMEVEANEWDPHRLNKASYLLVSLSFVVRSNLAGESPSLSMHPLAHAWAKDRQELIQQGQTWIATACIVALSILCYGSPRDNLVHLQSLLNIEVKTAFSLGPKPMLVSIFIIFCQNLATNRDDSRLKTLLQDIFGILAIEFDKPSIEYLEIYRIYGINLQDIGDLANSLQLYIQIAKILDERLPHSHYKRLISQHNVANAYHASGEVEKAIEIFEQVVEAQEDLHITNGRRLMSQHELARAYVANGQVDKAIELLEQVVEIKGTMPIAHPERLMSQHVLARAYHENGQADKAIELFEQVVEIRESVLPITHYDRLAAQDELAFIYNANRKAYKATHLLEQVVKIREELLPTTHHDRLGSEHELGHTYLQIGRVKEAIKLLEQVVKNREEILPVDNQARLMSQHELARGYVIDGQVEKAIKILEQVMKHRCKLPTDHPSRLMSQHVLARAYYKNGQVDKAIKLFEQVVDSEGALPITHPDRLFAQHELACAYNTDGQVDKAVELLEQVVKIQEEALPVANPERLSSQHELAHIYLVKGKGGRVKEAIDLLERVVNVREEVLPVTNTQRLASQHELAYAYYLNGQVEKAIELMEHVVKIKEEVQPATDNSRLISQSLLARFKKGV